MSDIKNNNPVDTLGRPIRPMRICSLSPSFGLYSAGPVQKLRDKGWEVVPRPPEMSLDRASVLEFFRDCDGVVPGMVKLDREMMAALPRLKVIAVHGAGVDHIDHKAAEELGIAVCNVPGGNAVAVAELTLGPDAVPGPAHFLGRPPGQGRRLGHGDGLPVGRAHPGHSGPG